MSADREQAEKRDRGEKISWKSLPLGAVATLQRGFDLPAESRNQGPFPVISSGGITGYHSEAKVSGPGVITGRYGSIGEVYFVEGDYWPLNTTLWVKDFHGNDPKFIFHLLKTFDFKKFSDKTGVPGVNRNDLHKVKVLCPPLDIQKIIVEIIDQWDVAINKTEGLIDAKRKQLSCYVSHLICNIPHTRIHIRDVASEVSIRNMHEKCRQVLSVTNYRGFVLPEEQFERCVASGNLANYKMIENGQYAYNPSRINVGSIARLDDWGEGVLSPMYVVFKLNGKKINSDFFLHWLSSYEARERIKRSAQGSVRETVSFSDFGAISLPLPDLKTQDKIAKALNAMKKEITLLQQLADAYREQKRGLMQKLLTGQWSVNTRKEGI